MIVLHDSVVIFKPPRGSGWVPGDGDYEYCILITEKVALRLVPDEDHT